MKPHNLFFALVLAAFISIFALTSFAQEAKTPETPGAKESDTHRPHDQRADILQRLGLTPEQIEQIHQINIVRKPLMDEAQKHLRASTRLLDAAIYAEQVNDADVAVRLKEVQAAQADVSRIRFMNELAVRRVLTPDQLARFREMRQRFEQMRQERQNQRSLDGRPGQRRMRRGGPPEPDSQPGPQTPDTQRQDL